MNLIKNTIIFISSAIILASCSKTNTKLENQNATDHKKSEALFQKIVTSENEGIMRNLYGELPDSDKSLLWDYKLNEISTTTFSTEQLNSFNELKEIKKYVFSTKLTSEEISKIGLDWRTKALKYFTKDEVYNMAYSIPRKAISSDNAAINCDCATGWDCPWIHGNRCNPGVCLVTPTCGFFWRVNCTGNCTSTLLQDRRNVSVETI